MNYPTVNTKLVILLGNPLGHSISPSMHNRVFEKLGLDYCYLPVQVRGEDLQAVFSGLKRMNVAGFNVTIPHKIAIIEHLDDLDPLAKTIGAVNTILVQNGRTIGYNTDGEGFIRSLEEAGGIAVANKRVFLLGCGGAARAIAMTLAFRGVETIFISNRTPSTAEALADEINSKIGNCAKAVTAVAQEQATTLGSCDILINTTSLGMSPRETDCPIDVQLLTANLVVADIVYNPHMTRLLSAAQAKGCRIVHGIGMLIHQGAAGFKLWTGVEPQISEMAEAANTLLAAKKP